MWILIRVALQTTIFSATDSHDEYKLFMAFFMSQIGHLAMKHDVSSDLMHCIKAKLARRLSKLGSAASHFLKQTVHDAVQAVDTVMQGRWESIVSKQKESSSWDPQSLDIDGDTALS